MVGVEKPQGVLIQKNSLSLFKRDTVFAPILLAFGLVPLEPYFTHMYTVLRYCRSRKGFSVPNFPNVDAQVRRACEP